MYRDMKEDRRTLERTCIIVWNNPPLTLCSCGREIFAMNRVPAANTKSAPKTEVMAAGKPKAQYGALGSMSAKSSAATEVMRVPRAKRELAGARRGSKTTLRWTRDCTHPSTKPN